MEKKDPTTTVTCPSEDDKFASAELYDCSDCAESLTHTEVEDAVLDLLYGYMEPGCDPIKVIKEQSPVTVIAYKRQSIENLNFESICTDAAERILEWLDDEYGDPEGGEGAKADELGKEMLPVVKKWLVDHYKVWSCEKVGEREYSAEEVEAMMREHVPDWFEKEERDDVGAKDG